MLKIRLSRAWKKNMPFFKIVVTEHTKAAKHWYTEVLGFYNPVSKEFKIKALDKVKTYISNWAQFSPRIEKLMKTNNITL
jgi:small subunit ribosomal protein S16